MLRSLTLMAAVLTGAAGLIVLSAPAAQAHHNPGHNQGPPVNLHCPDHNTIFPKISGPVAMETVVVGGKSVLVTISGENVTFSEKVKFCVKGGNELTNTGVLSGTQYTHPQDISYVVVYEVKKKVEVCDPETGEIISVYEKYADRYLPVDDEACEEEEEPEVPEVPEVPEEPGRGAGPTPAEEEEQVEAPAGGVKAGGGAGTSALLGVLASVGTIGAGVASRKWGSLISE